MSLVEAVHPGAFDSADVHEHILAAIIGLNEAEAFLAIKPFYRTLRHMTFFHVRVSVGHTVVRPGYVRDLGRSLVRRVQRGEAKSFGRNSMNYAYCMSAAPLRFICLAPKIMTFVSFMVFQYRQFAAV